MCTIILLQTSQNFLLHSRTKLIFNQICMYLLTMMSAQIIEIVRMTIFRTLILSCFFFFSRMHMMRVLI